MPWRKTAAILLQTTLVGAVLLPIVPVWGITLRLAAFAAAWHLTRRVCRCNRRAVGCLLIAAAGLSLLPLAELAGYLAVHPVGAVHTLLSSMHGLPLRWETGLALRLADLVWVVALASFAWNRGRRQWPKARRLVILGLLGFAVWPVLASLSEVYQTSGALDARTLTGAFEQNLAANTSQHFWVLFALLALLHSANRRRAERFCGLLAAAGAIQAGIVLTQHLVGDYSYVIEAPAIEDYFLRVKGTYYYHASAGLFLLVAFFAALARAAGRKHTWGEWTMLGLIVAALASNSTRAISLAMVAGGLTYAALLLGRSLPPLRLGVAAMVVALFSTSILYEKGVSRGTAETVDSATGSAVEEQAVRERDALESLAESNRPRLALLFAAAGEAVAQPLLGSGPGNVSIPLDGRSLGGSLKTNSSHALLPDLALGAGLPAMLAFVVLPCCLAGLALRRRWNASASSSAAQFAAAIAGLLAAFFVAALFLPQELNYTIGVFLALCAVGLVALTQSRFAVPTPSAICSVGFRRWVVAPLTVAAAMWVGLTSLSITAPIVEFASLHGRETAWPYSRRDPVYTTSPPLAFALRRVLPLVGCGDREVRLLPDDPRQLPKCHCWVLWHPAYDKNYPNLRRVLPYLTLRPYAVAPAYRLPATWQMAPSQQLLVSFVWVGPWAHGVDPDEDSSDLQTTPPEQPAPLLGRRPKAVVGAGSGEVEPPSDEPFPAMRVDRHPEGHARYSLDREVSQAPSPNGPVVRSAVPRAVARGIGPPREGEVGDAAPVTLPAAMVPSATGVWHAAYRSSTGWKQLNRVRTASAWEAGPAPDELSHDARGPADAGAPAELFPTDDSQPLAYPSGACGRLSSAASQIVGYELTWAHAAEEVFRWQIELESLAGERMFLNDQHGTSPGIVGVYRDLPRESHVGRIRVVFPEGMNAAAVRVRLFEGLMPDVAPRIVAREEHAGGELNTVPLATDGNHGTAWIGQRNGPTALVFDLGEGPPTSIGLYGLSGVGFRDFDGANPTGWVLQGSADGQTWTDLDERSDQYLPVSPGQMARYRVAAGVAFRYYRLLLEAESYGRSGHLGLAEVQLFPRM